MSSNLNIKYGKKMKTSSETNEEVVNIPENKSPGTIYVAENNLKELELYLDTPAESTNSSSRKRLDSKIYIGPEDTSNGVTSATVFQDYDVWIDTSGTETGIATESSNGLMSSSHVQRITDLESELSNLINQLQEMKIRIVAGPWRDALAENSANTLTVLMPSDWNESEFIWSPGTND